jgi:hypothetical protein
MKGGAVYGWANDSSLTNDELLRDIYVDVPVSIKQVPSAHVLYEDAFFNEPSA